MSDITPTGRVIAENLKYLIEKNRIEIQSIAERSGISLRAINKVRKGHNTTIETLDALAGVFYVNGRRLQGWQLASPTMREDIERHDAMERWSRAYEHTNDIGRQALDDAIKIAEQLAAYSVNKTSETSRE